MKRRTATALGLAIALLVGAATVSVTAQAEGHDNMKFPPDRMLAIQQAIGDMV